MKPAIEVRGVWKQYNRGIDRRYKSLRDTLVSLPFLLRGEDTEKFWALEDINFDIMPGESVGIIGRNGAGKSTLLKILSRITPPTKGEIILRGRVASLLEVGTGFHPELTGRENIYFNGSILGMKYAEIRKKFDEIVDFSGVESFIDTPLKHYSSGMQMRLAFSVAAHLDTEILLIDEVLAVGDADFQKKCLGKMDEVSKGEGKTLVFVSHDMHNISALCMKGIYIKNGTLIKPGLLEVDSAISDYLDQNNDPSLNRVIREGNQIITLERLIVKSKSTNEIYNGGDASIILILKNNSKKEIRKIRVDIGINNSTGRRIGWLTTEHKAITPENFEIEFYLPNQPYIPGNYDLNVLIQCEQQTSDWLKNIGHFTIFPTQNYLSEKSIPKNQGDILLEYKVSVI